jgi:hypothetical protein
MDKEEYKKVIASLPQEEKSYFQKWFVSEQDTIDWDVYRSKGYKNVIKTKKIVEDHALKVTGKPKQLNLAFMPVKLARTSPFFPMSRKDMKDRPIFNEVVMENAWGKITVSGVKLSIYDESVLLAVLSLSRQHRHHLINTTYTELCHTMNINKGTTQYNSISQSLKRLTGTVVNTELYEQKDGKKTIIEDIAGTMINHVRQQPQSTKVEIDVSPYFLALYGANLTTSINLDERSKLKGDITKAIYRFLQTHEAGAIPFGMLTFCKGINLETEQPLAEIRKKLRSALTELCAQGHIKKGWKIDNSDRIFIPR